MATLETMKSLLGWCGADGGLVALTAFNALTIGVADVRLFADAGGGALGVLANLRHLGNTVDQEWHMSAASGHAVQLSAAVRLVEFAVRCALANRWKHHERRWSLLAFFLLHATSIRTRSDVSSFAGAAWNADTRANGIGLVAAGIAALALAELLVVAADVRRHRVGIGGRGSAVGGSHTDALFVLQVAGFAEAADHTLLRAQRGVGVGACRGASGAAGHEDLVFLALANFRWVGEEHGGLRCFALAGRHADAFRVSQVSLFAKASDNAVLGTRWARVRVGAGRRASGAASVEFFIVRASWHSFGFLHRDMWVRGLAVLRAHAFAAGVLQETFIAEAAVDACDEAGFRLFRIGASRNAA